MGQQQVYAVLKKNKNRWLSSREIINKLGESTGSVITSLAKLRKGKFVDFKFVKRPETVISGRKIYVYRVR